MEDAEGNGTTWGRLPMRFSRKGRARGRPARCRRAGGPLPAGIPPRIRRGMHGRKVFRIRPTRGRCGRSQFPGDRWERRL
eukprot:7384201-Heterocapsa_arctica.AAC.1